MSTNVKLTTAVMPTQTASTPPAHTSVHVKQALKVTAIPVQMSMNASQKTVVRVTLLVLTQSDPILASAIKASLAMVSVALISMSAHPACTTVMLMRHARTKLAHFPVPALTVPRVTVFRARTSTNVPELLITVRYMQGVRTQ